VGLYLEGGGFNMDYTVYKWAIVYFLLFFNVFFLLIILQCIDDLNVTTIPCL
jgi:hypothetical protein